MRILVQKFGGTSLSTAEAREKVVQHIRRELDRGYRLAVVVSAMGRRGEPYATDTLLDWMQENGSALPPREKDLLLCCGEIISATTLCGLLRRYDISATVMTGAQAGFRTDHQFGNARILDVCPERVIEGWNHADVVIVTGFQGQTDEGDITTLGRGGSDTSATALGAALHAEIVDIYTDVNGILTADPRLVEDAKPLSVVSYTEMCNLAHHGAKVIHPRAVEIAMQAQVPVRVRSTFSEEEGTLVTHPEGFHAVETAFVDRFVTGIAYVSNVTQISVEAEAGIYDLQLKVFKAMAQNHISVDFINVTPSGAVYTVFDTDAPRAREVLEEMGFAPKFLSGCAKVSVIGGGINGVPGIMATIVEALTEQEIQILQSADSNTTIWVLVRKEDMVRALRALHSKFHLER
ncbi:aspartate kinase [Paenibacillus thiaminolyticus]|uniref:Aspartokinase n=1 Tax=Paenibacillus thiaminolyticus TaxID=49283 RepID=A0AAJ1G3Q3_PANTH|nr:aspartate kinase [Paenibacillus thiaminolyticus]MCY9537031.1 aspartate kinase [Paenibacillus thiaminolyticus]MCY9603210.1 aspartate kinase [Paenibacillus thiaminolyticus]MCY9608040.1 aspartate kinase [Paenibacillus thiaminolyticus]MCY9613657.1 aspartate kinase [Paenibacillus thiaminolyticus]MCY9618819.1 aspartate kinase [Paenibacillus thiaminolyticus]